MQTVFQNQTTDAIREVALNNGNTDTIYIKGVYGSAFVHVEISPDDGETWFRDDTGYFSFHDQEYIADIDVAPDYKTRARIVIEGADANTNLTVLFG